MRVWKLFPDLSLAEDVIEEIRKTGHAVKSVKLSAKAAVSGLQVAFIVEKEGSDYRLVVEGEKVMLCKSIHCYDVPGYDSLKLLAERPDLARWVVDELKKASAAHVEPRLYALASLLEKAFPYEKTLDVFLR